MSVDGAVRSLKAIARTANLFDPEAVKAAIAKRPVSDAQKMKLSEDYAKFARLSNPRLLGVSFRSLRHHKATMEYARTKDILHVKQLLVLNEVGVDVVPLTRVLVPHFPRNLVRYWVFEDEAPLLA